MTTSFQTFELGDVSTIFAGGDKPDSFSEIKTEKYNIPVYANGETNDGLQGFTDIARVNDPAVTISARGTIGYSVLRKTPFVPIVRLLTLTPDPEKLDINYLFYYLKLYRQEGLGSSQAQLTVPQLSSRTINIPSLKYQNLIGLMLSAIDSKIEINNKINSELEKLAKTIYDYWFIQFDFPDEKGKPYKSSGGKMVWNEEIKREIPEGWTAGGFNDIGEVVGGSTPSKANNQYFTKSGIPWITPKDLSLNTGKKFITRGEIDITPLGLKNASLKILTKGSVLLSSRAPIGYLAISRGEVTTNQGFKSIVPNDYYSTEYVYFTVQTYINAMIQYSSGSTFSEISASTLKLIKVPLPNSELVRNYTQKVKDIFAQQDILEKENDQLTAFRDWLLPMLMNGQVKVSGS